MNFALALLGFFKSNQSFNSDSSVSPVIETKVNRDFSFHEAIMGKPFQLRCGKPFTVLDMNYESETTTAKMIQIQIDGESETRLYYQDGIADELKLHPLDLVMVN